MLPRNSKKYSKQKKNHHMFDIDNLENEKICNS